MSLKVVNLGLPKTGTTTLARALRRSGYRVADYKIRAKQTADETLHNQYVAELLYRGYYETGDPAALIADFDAITEMSMLSDDKSLWPQMDFGMIDAIRQHHPDVKFIASNRDSWDVSQSMLAWSDLGTARLPDNAIPGLPIGYGETTKQRIQWIDGHYAHLRVLFGNDPDFLEYNVADPQIKTVLAEFLGHPVPWWGRANANAKHIDIESEVA